jgi:hypothetical protein
MRKLRAIFLRFLGFFVRSRVERELNDEIETNLQLQIEDHIREGMRPEEARRATLVKFGSVEAAKDACRDRRGLPFIENLFRDATYAFRILSRNKGWTLVAVLSLGLGIGANTAIFSAINGLFLKTLPVARPQELVRLKWAGENDQRLAANE